MKCCSRSVFLAAPALAAVVLALPALAQETRVIQPSSGGRRIVSALPNVQAPPPLSPERAQRFAKVLGLDAEQTTAAEALYEGYSTSVNRAQKQMREGLHRAEEDMQDGDRSAFERMLNQAIAENGRKMTELRDQFLSDLKALLREDQAGNWEALERLRRRDNGLPRGSLSGSTMDLLNIVDGLKLSDTERAPLGETLAQYELDLDRALKERQAAAEAQMDGGGSRSFQGDEVKKFFARQRDVDVKVQDVNQRYARQLAELVPAAKRGVFDELVQQQTFRNVYRDSKTAKRARAAQSLAGLSAAQRESIERALAEYNRSLRGANDRWASAIDRAERAGQTPLSHMGMLGEKADPELTEARKARRDLDNALREQLGNVLTPEQLAELPTGGDPSGMSGRRVIAVGGPGGQDMFITDEDLDDDGGPMMVGGAGGGGVVMIKHSVTTTGGDGGEDEHHEVTVTTPPPSDKPRKKD